MTISEKIFALLEQKELSQKEFSEKTEISQSTISDWKRKRTNPSSDKILKICEVLQVSPYELLAEDDSVSSEITADHNIVLNKNEIILLENYRNFSSRQKERLLGYLEALRES
ncbi:helix-turn-helix transcriptional regulator [Mediterraneibacter catenae]|jgi:transcriptional regulator with XRE-family HTH domain|uniref:Helix-turn-helix transcriptional regulator n=1 Tax=Mediterraneibacter catenae TaxID=2594882 RepID=A0A5M9HU23_9FIRM|nr:MULTISPECIES: helix-turn-helix transcriptional regulator [Mediterraneibacter]KAA8500470.1 helix-turn-helix transcriptional regulator [Mediterraneibacter catenae]MDM8126373.1 helix-turn-helix transcriptional regulator [Mediterraneibacter glycyrrhizinilyticus]MDM8211390.1 helix-turn-helix transcriptional regulator [Mediterraneibacter glycyrrhizinilyticus]OUO28219.1 hypothetical protein B5F86_08225 [Lachnoclostridium sp. An298]